MCEGASKQILNLKILPRRDRAPTPRFEIPGSATAFNWNKFVKSGKLFGKLLLVWNIKALALTIQNLFARFKF